MVGFDGASDGAARRDSQRGKLLYLAREFPVPVSSDNRLRTFNWVLRLSRRFEITFVAHAWEAPAPHHLEAIAPYCARLVVLRPGASRGPARLLRSRLGARARYLRSGVPAEAWHLQSDGVRDALRGLRAETDFDVVFAERWAWGREALESASYAVVDAGELQASRHQGALDLATSPIRRALARHLWRGHARAEAEVLSLAHLVLAQTPHDRMALNEASGTARALVLPAGLDTSYFAPRPGVVDPANVLFFASLGSPAQRDALQHLHRDLMPRVRVRIPRARLTVLASERPRELEALLRADPSLRFTGPVEDPRTEMARAAVAAVPLRFGSGSRSRLAQLLSMGIPVVATRTAARSLGVKSGDGLLVTPDGPDFADALSQVLLDSSLREDLSRKGREMAQARLSIAATYDRMADLLASGVQRA
jgi:glycosyltransferase involved in cell wall biosynthesis